ncbi:hypothetical protein ACS0TY_012434 [Phlomoides rotata]
MLSMLTLGSLIRFGSVAAWVLNIVACMGGCIGCETSRTKLNSSLHDSFRGQENHALTKSQASLSEDIWTTSACEVDNVAVQSCGSISSTSALPQMHDVHGAGCSSKPSEFVNHGVILWNQMRQKWIGNKEPASGPQQLRDSKLSWNETYDSLLSCNKPFQQPIPLGEMIDFLVDIWEQEGMYD